jgi:collagen type III alpha
MPIPFDLWGQRGYPHADIAGESHYTQAIRSLFGNDFKPTGSEIVVSAVLTPEPGNAYDRNAVGVWIGGNLVGYLQREVAARYAPILTHLTSHGWAPQVMARVWASEWDDYDGRHSTLRGSVRLDLAEPHMIVPSNLPPGGQNRMLPTGNAIQVTGEDKHLAQLVQWLRPEGECWVHATLHELVEQTARASRTLVEVRIDGGRIGQLSPRMSGELLPAIHHLAEEGMTASARAVVKGNRIKAEVVLYVARAHELPDSWLNQRVEAAPAPTEHEPIPPQPSAFRFAVPPDWPNPPAGWVPPPGWRPDPTWKPVPEGWQWWVPVWD